MSKSNASAKSRRAFISPQQNSPSIGQPQSQSAPTPSTGLTLQQVIAVIDKRLINLETFVKDESGRKVTFQDEMPPSQNVPSNLAEIISEYNSRFDLLAEEINNLKDVIIKLQTFTMEVNKTLMDERIRVLSDIGNAPNSSETFTIENVISELNGDEVETVPETNNILPAQDSVSTSLENLGGVNYRRQRGK